MATVIQQRGLAAIDGVFAKAKAEKRATFMPYFPIGYPDYATSLDVIAAFAEAGADIIEVGVPFSDPLADGPTIQVAGQVALKNGTTLPICIKAIAELRKRGVKTPIVLMGYANPFMAYGYDRLTHDAEKAGIDGFIVPDLPADEADDLQKLVEAHRLSLTYLVAPTSSASRIRLVAQKSRGFIYLVSVMGVTGAREAIPQELVQNIAAIRTVTQLPIAVGFGVNTPQQAKQLGELVDGVIVGTALVKAGGKSVEEARNLAAQLRNAL